MSEKLAISEKLMSHYCDAYNHLQSFSYRKLYLRDNYCFVRILFQQHYPPFHGSETYKKGVNRRIIVCHFIFKTTNLRVICTNLTVIYK